MAFSTGNCKMQHPIEMFIGAMYWCREEIHFYETVCTIYLCSYQKRLFPALLKKGCLKYRNLWGVQKAGRYLQQKLCPFQQQRVSLNRLAIKRTHNILNIISNTLNTQYHIEICDNLSQEVFGKHISISNASIKFNEVEKTVVNSKNVPWIKKTLFHKTKRSFFLLLY